MPVTLKVPVNVGGRRCAYAVDDVRTSSNVRF